MESIIVAVITGAFAFRNFLSVYLPTEEHRIDYIQD